MSVCSPFCPFAACPECDYQGGESLPVGRAVTGGTGRLDPPISDPRERRNSGGLAGTYVGGPTG